MRVKGQCLTNHSSGWLTATADFNRWLDENGSSAGDEGLSMGLQSASPWTRSSIDKGESR